MWLLTVGIMMQTSRPWTAGLSPGTQQQLVQSNAYKAAGLYALTFVVAVGRFFYCSSQEAKARAAGSARRGIVEDDVDFGAGAITTGSVATASSVASGSQDGAQSTVVARKPRPSSSNNGS